MQYISHSPEETENIAAGLAVTLRGGDCVALYGGLGAGKTAFVRGLARGLGIEAPVSSPTYAIVNVYKQEARSDEILPPASCTLSLVHFDMYRVSTWADLESCGFFDYLDSGAVLAVEWSESIASALPEEALRVTIERGKEENERVVEVDERVCV